MTNRKNILVLSFFPAFSPPKSGGELRLYNICKNLAKYYDINILSFTYPSNEKYLKVSMLPNVTEIRIPKSKIHKVLHHIFYHYGHIHESSGVVVSIASHFSRTYKEIVNNSIRNADIIISTHPYLFKKVFDKVVIYESYNMEYNLQKKAFGNSIIAKFLSCYIYYIEKNACLSSDLIFAVSEEDKSDFHNVYNVPSNKVILSNNGVDTSEIKLSTDSEKNIYKTRLNLKNTRTLLFFGSAHPPNINAAKIIIDELAPSLPEFTFLIAGKVSDYFTNNRIENGVLREKDVETYFLTTGKTALLTHGWYNVEYWNGVATRWTKKNFGFIVKNTDTSKIFFKLFSLEEVEIVLKLNNVNKESIILKPNVWTYYEYDFNKVDMIISKIVIDKTIKETHGHRILGVAIQEIGYEYNGIKKMIDLSSSYKLISNSQCIPDNVLILGLVSDETKKNLLKASDAALNPLTYGSGTNLKMFEYLAAGLPIITTSIGARGIEVINNIHAIICEIAEFKKNILGLFKDDAIYEKLKKNGRKLVEEKYDWEKITDIMHEDIKECYEKKNRSDQ